MCRGRSSDGSAFLGGETSQRRRIGHLFSRIGCRKVSRRTGDQEKKRTNRNAGLNGEVSSFSVSNKRRVARSSRWEVLRETHLRLSKPASFTRLSERRGSPERESVSKINGTEQSGGDEQKRKPSSARERDDEKALTTSKDEQKHSPGEFYYYQPIGPW